MPFWRVRDAEQHGGCDGCILCLDAGVLGIDILSSLSGPDETRPDNHLWVVYKENGWIVSDVLWTHEEQERKIRFSRSRHLLVKTGITEKDRNLIVKERFRVSKKRYSLRVFSLWRRAWVILRLRGWFRAGMDQTLQWPCVCWMSTFHQRLHIQFIEDRWLDQVISRLIIGSIVLGLSLLCPSLTCRSYQDARRLF